jgi:sugar-specific transcriptional regulator TrmB
MLRERGLSFAFALVAIAAGQAVEGRAQSLDQVTGTQERVAEAAIASQKKIDAMSDQADALFDEYRNENRRIEALDAYNEQLERLVESQREELASVESQIEGVRRIEREIIPLMQRMVDGLARFVALDVPFLAEERTARVDGLRDLMDRSDVTVSEKFRRVLEAYQVENDYGRTIDSYRGDLVVDGEPRTVDFLSVGRVVLLYQTLDGDESGIWDQAQREWKPLPGEYDDSIRRGIRIALKQAAPNLLELPVPAAQVVQ